MPQQSLLPLRSGPGVAVIAATVLASMTGFLDASVVNVAVPAIARDLGASVVALQWSLTGYLLTAAALLLVAGSLADRYGRRRLLIIGLLIMLVASVGCAIAPSFPVLIAARVLYRPAMVVLTGLCVVAAAISAVFVRDCRTAPPRFAAPAPYHGCALPHTGTGDRVLTTTARTSEAL